MKLSISNIGWGNFEDEAMYEYISGLGFSGVEIAPTRLFTSNPYENLEQAKEWGKELQTHYRLVVPSMQSIWYGRGEKLFGSESERKALLAYTKQAIDFAEAISCHNLVLAVRRIALSGIRLNGKRGWLFFVSWPSMQGDMVWLLGWRPILLFTEQIISILPKRLWTCLRKLTDRLFS